MLRRRFSAWPITILALSILATTLSAATPVLNGVSPRGVQRGKDVVLVFSGARLADAKEVLFYTPGFQVGKLEVVNDAQVKVTVNIPATCDLGEHAVRLRTQSGLSELRTFWVGAYPTVDEKEPNNEFANPQKIPMNVTVQGVVDSEDVDYFAVEGKKGQRLSVEIEAMRLANTLFDPAIAILDSKRFELASSDDTPLLGQDSLASVVLPADGTYIIQVRESAYQGNGGCGYRLHVGNFPRPLGAFPAGGKAGEEVEITFLGDPAGPFKQKVKMPGQVMERYGFHPGEANQLCPSSIPLRVSNVGNTLEVEPNDTPDKATPGTFPTAFNGVIEKAGDVDNFRFKGKKGETYDVHCYARRLGSPLDPVMTLSVLGGGAIASSDDAIGPDSYFRITFPEDREYVLTITDHLGKGGAAFFYRVEFLLATPIATVSIPKVNIFSQERQTLSIPRGGRMATIFSVGRANFGGEMSVGLTGLPQGITPVSENLQGNLDTVPVVFEAGANAPVAGGLVTFALKHVDPKHPPVESAFAQTVELVTGGPGQSVYWKKDVNRMAIAVVEESPYSIEVVEPKVPLVQNGSMQLKIVAKRKPGFTAAITVYPLFNPPGVSSASAVTIPANANEVLMPLNAAGNAQARKWKTAFIAVSDAGKGPIWVSSQLATIEVAPPILAITMDRAMVEQGKQTELFCKVQVLSPFAGEAVVKLLGLPTKVTTPDIKITKDAKDFAFRIATDPTSPAGTHRNLFCQVEIRQNGEVITGNSGSSELRLDVPVVKTAPPPTPAKPATAAAPPPAAPAAKRLSRLEQLRKEQEEREKNPAAPTPPPPAKK